MYVLTKPLFANTCILFQIMSKKGCMIEDFLAMTSGSEDDEDSYEAECDDDI